MSEQKKPKIDLKARLGKKSVAAPAGAAIPPPVGIPKPPVMGGASQAPPRPSNPYASSPYGAAEAPPPPPPRVEPQAITVEMSAEVIAEHQKMQRRGYIVTAVVAVFVGLIGFTFGGSRERDKGAKAALEGAKDLITEIEKADKTADDLNEVLTKAAERLGKNEYPEEEIARLGGINIPFDGTHLTDKGIGRFRGALVTQIITYANTAQKANDQKEKIQSLLSGTKVGIQDLLQQKTDPKVRWGVWVESGPGGPWANMQTLPSPFLVKSATKVKDKDGKEKDYEWPLDVQIPRGNEKVTLKRYKSGDVSSGDPQFIPVAPQTESMVCPSSTIVRIRQELGEMQTVLKGDATPGVEKTGFLQMGETVVQSLKKLLQG